MTQTVKPRTETPYRSPPQQNAHGRKPCAQPRCNAAKHGWTNRAAESRTTSTPTG